MIFFDDDNPKVFFVFSYIHIWLLVFFPDFGVMEGLTLVDQGDSRLYMINMYK